MEAKGPATSRPDDEVATTRAVSNRRILGVLLGAGFVVSTAQLMLRGVLPPLSRDVGLEEYQLGLVITAGAVVNAAASIVWGRLCDRWGTRRVLLTGLLTAAVGLGLFAAVSAWASGAPRPSGLVVSAMMITRGALFGIGVGAVTVAVLAYGGTTYTGRARRTRFVGLLSAVHAAAGVVGPGLTGLLALIDLLAPVQLAPVLLVLAAVAVATLLPHTSRPTEPSSADPTGDPSHRGRVGRQVLPFLATGFLLFLSLSMLQNVLGFLLQDRLGLDAESAAGAFGIAGVVTGVTLITVQAVVAPRLGWGPVRLIAVGSAVAVAGHLLVVVGSSMWTILAGLVVVTTGLGLGIPGYITGAGLGLPPSVQGQVAGLVNATNSATGVVGPLLGTALYGLVAAVPILLCAALCAASFVVAGTVLRRSSPAGDEPGP